MPKVHYWLFAAVLVVLCLFFGYWETTAFKPLSSHAWRQADGASFAQNYMHYNHPFEPRLHNRQMANGYVVGEFTGIYYLAGMLYRAFGTHEFILRGIHLLLLIVGLMALFRMTFEVLGSIFWSYILPVLLFSSPVLAYYGNNFLPDAPAFGCLLVGWGAFMRYYKDQKTNNLFIALGWFAAAGLLKITMLMSVAALGGLLVAEGFGWATFKTNGEKIFPRPWHAAAAFGTMVLAIGGWYAFSIWYNRTHGSDYFLNTIHSPWNRDDMGLLVYTFYRTFFFWSKYYAFPLNHFLFVFLTFFVLNARKYPGHFLYSMTLLTFIGFMLIYQLWYYQFNDHDYYIISGYIYLVFLLLSTLRILKRDFEKLYMAVSFRVVVVLFLLVNVFYAKTTFQARFKGQLMSNINPALYEDKFKTYLTNIGIEREDLVISLPDFSPNVTLYLMDRNGFTNWVDRNGTPLNTEIIENFIQRGAKNLILHDTAMLNEPFLKPFLEKEIGRYKNIRIFDLSD